MPGSIAAPEYDHRMETVARMYFEEGLPIVRIAETLDVHESTIYRYLTRSMQNGASKKVPVDVYVTEIFENTLRALGRIGDLLSRDDFLRNEDPDRVKAISVTYGILSERIGKLLKNYAQASEILARRPNDMRAIADPD